MKKKYKRIKIGFAASSGGHYEQLMMLRPLMEKYDSFLVTEKTPYGTKASGIRTYNVNQINRKEILFLPKLVCNTVLSLVIILKERPNILITTGVLAIIPLAFLTKLYRGKLIYIESFAKVTSPTISGKTLYKHADRFYVQWKEMLDIFPDAIYKGGIY